MKIGIYTPYLDILGGGERYIASIASVLEKNHSVTIFASKANFKMQFLKTFGIDLTNTLFLSDDIFKKRGLINKYLSLSGFDIFFYMTDGSLFPSSAKKNFLIIQSPVHIPSKNFINNLKIANWQIICYSNFMSDVIKKRINKDSLILPPFISQRTNTKISAKGQKENIILSVGRFFLYPHNKKQEILIDVFRDNYKDKFKGYKLVLAGGLTEKSGEDYLSDLKNKAKGLPVEFIINATFAKINDLYSRSKIYWHAAGFGEDLELHPERAEHFGITTVEAASYGAVPVVFAGGGQKEIIQNSISGYLWNTKEELASHTFDLINTPDKWKVLSENAQKRAKDFPEGKFYEQIQKIIS